MVRVRVQQRSTDLSRLLAITHFYERKTGCSDRPLLPGKELDDGNGQWPMVGRRRGDRRPRKKEEQYDEARSGGGYARGKWLLDEAERSRIAGEEEDEGKRSRARVQNRGNVIELT
ncbi:hypothetical protein KM043_014172 [Ampulex compressa]|nr:hypothetical protein KM043_014172 [Ampulex compressa]